ncbi:hypothetical protein GCM10023187_53880 [Nibrella viscosa]|uniref:Lipoprotein n=1 Tax=Nibrella viscosa TaxID=1084524 RepID=A0ABP8KZ05_9BACT
MKNSFFILAFFTLLGCSTDEANEKAINFNVLGKKIYMPLKLDTAINLYKLDQQEFGKRYKIDTTRCVTVTACSDFKLTDSLRLYNENIWGINITLFGPDFSFKNVLKTIEGDLKVKFLPAVIFNDSCLRAENGKLKFAIRKFLHHNPFQKRGLKESNNLPFCFKSNPVDAIVLYMTYGLKDREFQHYVISNGSSISSD